LVKLVDDFEMGIPEFFVE